MSARGAGCTSPAFPVEGGAGRLTGISKSVPRALRPDGTAKFARILIAAGLIAMIMHMSFARGVEPGRAAPECMLTDIADPKPFDMSHLRGKVVYVDFWASWCASCARSFAFLNELDHDFGARGVQVLGINVDQKPQDAVAFLAVHPARFAIAADHGGECPRRFGVRAMPSSYIIDRRGTVRHVHVGFRNGDDDTIRRLLEAVLAEGSSIQ